MSTWRSFAALACAMVVATAADLGPDLRNAARKGDAAAIASLLSKGASVDSADKQGRTPLMLAAERGRAAAVKLLLEKGAKADARDRQGWTAYGLAVMEGRDEVVRLFPAREPVAAALEVAVAMDNVYTSCFLKPRELADQVAGIQVDAMVAAAVRDFASANGKGLLKFVDNGQQITVAVKVRPAVSCLQQQTLDNLTLAIDVRILRTSDQAVLLEKTLGGGLKGLKARTVSSPVQYAPLFSDWAKAHASQIYWAAVEAWLRAR